MNWILFGFKGSGKTYFGSRLGLPFLDTDVLIEEQEKLSPREIVQERGEDYFRKIEKEIILSLNPTKTVIAVGGGAVLDQQNFTHLQKIGKLLYLKCPKEILEQRDLPAHFQDFEKMYSIRKPKYEIIPATRIDLEGKTDQEILEAIWQVINLDKSSGSPHGASRTAKPLA